MSSSKQASPNKTSVTADNKDNERVTTPEETINIGELSRERDMLLEQVELLKEEQQFSQHVHQATEFEKESLESYRIVLREKDELLQENQQISRELEILREAITTQETSGMMTSAKYSPGGQSHQKAISKLLAEIKELRHENQLLRKKAIVNENGLVYYIRAILLYSLLYYEITKAKIC